MSQRPEAWPVTTGWNGSRPGPATKNVSGRRSSSKANGSGVWVKKCHSLNIADGRSAVQELQAFFFSDDNSKHKQNCSFYATCRVKVVAVPYRKAKNMHLPPSPPVAVSIARKSAANLSSRPARSYSGDSRSLPSGSCLDLASATNHTLVIAIVLPVGIVTSYCLSSD